MSVRMLHLTVIVVLSYPMCEVSQSFLGLLDGKWSSASSTRGSQACNILGGTVGWVLPVNLWLALAPTLRPPSWIPDSRWYPNNFSMSQIIVWRLILFLRWITRWLSWLENLLLQLQLLCPSTELKEGTHSKSLFLETMQSMSKKSETSVSTHLSSSSVVDYLGEYNRVTVLWSTGHLLVK